MEYRNSVRYTSQKNVDTFSYFAGLYIDDKYDLDPSPRASGPS